MNLIESCKRFIEVDTSPQVGTLELGKYILQLSQELGLKAELHTDTHDGLEQANVIVRFEKSSEKNFLLQTHLDTVDPGNYGLWTRTGSNPFNPSIYQETIYGLGAADVKLDFICKLFAMCEFKNKNLAQTPILVGTFGEELGMHGALKIIRKKLIQANLALIGEPTDMQIVSAGKGFASIEIEIPFTDEEKQYRDTHNLHESATTQSRVFSGKSGQSTHPQFGENAILKMFQYLQKLPDSIAIMEISGGINGNSIPSQAHLEIDMVGNLNQSMGAKIKQLLKAIQKVEQEFQLYLENEFSPPFATMNIGMIRTHEEYVKISGCVRLPPVVTHEVYMRWMEGLRDTCNEIHAQFNVKDYKRPFRTQANSPIVKLSQDCMKELSLSTQLQSQSVCNEANVFSRFGIECVVWGPGKGFGNSHAPNENVKLSELERAIDFYKMMIAKVCQ